MARNHISEPLPPFTPGALHEQLFATAKEGTVLVIEGARWKIEELMRGEAFKDRLGNERAYHAIVVAGVDSANKGKKMSLATDDKRITAIAEQ